jgi:hypothetical protein
MSINYMVLIFLLSLPVLIAIDNNKMKIALLIFILLMLPVLLGVYTDSFDLASATQWFFWIFSMVFLKSRRIF